MILPDTSVWIDLFRAGREATREALLRHDLLYHPLVLGELAMGGLPDRRATLASLRKLNAPVIARDEEVLALIEEAPLHGLGLSYVDAHLLASVLVTKVHDEAAKLWTNDRRLHAAAAAKGVAFAEPGLN